MTAAVLENLGLLAEAPGGIERLRELILELATNGRLLGVNGDWRATQLRELVVSSGAGWSPSCDARPRSDDEWGVLKVSAVSWGQFRPDENKALPAHLTPRPELQVQPGDFLVSRANTAELVARSVVVEGTPPKLMLSDKIVRLRLSDACDPRFIQIANSAPEARRYYARVAGGTSSSMKNVSREQILALPVLLPPLAEQHRIVAKFDELMALCDRLEARQQDAEAAHARLVQALLDSLTQARDAEEFQACWQRLATAFAETFTSEASVEALAQAVRTLAFRGALSRDGAANWKQVRVNDAVQFLNGYAFKSEWFVPHGIRLVRNVNIAHGSIDWRDAACIPVERSDEFAAFSLKAGDVLLTLDRPIISTGLKVAVVRAGDLPCLLLQRVARLTPREHLVRAAYLLHWLRSPLFIDAIDPGRSNGVPHISTKQVGSMTIPLPALDEQDRIVANLDSLLALCDQLKARIAAARAKHAQLAEALVAQAVAA